MRKLRMSELNRLSNEEFKKADKHPVVVVLDNVRSVLNVGSVFRTSDAFKITAIHLCGLTATPPNREMNKTALGATESVNWAHFENTEDSIKALKTEGFSVFALEQTEGAQLLSDFSASNFEKIALVFGNEVMGVSESALALCDGVIEIPQFGTKHSINISVSAGIAIWHVVQPYLNE